MSKVITFGEILMRLSTPSSLRFSQANSFDVGFGGAEFNVAVSLANFGVNAEFVTILPENDLGKRALMEIRKHNVASGNIAFGGNRLGLYFLEEGSGIRGSDVIYDRAESAMAGIQTGMIDWERIFKDADVFHWSGITPAISQNAADVCLEALQFAAKAGLMVSCDLNYRAKLWNYGKQPCEIMPELLGYCNIILGDIDTALFMLGNKQQSPDYKDLKFLTNHYDLIFERYPNLKYMATTLRYSLHKNHQQIGGILYDRKQLYHSDTKDVMEVLDRIGTGDAFMGGLLYGLLDQGTSKQQALDFAIAACCFKHSVKGDFAQATANEIRKVCDGETSGKVTR